MMLHDGGGGGGGAGHQEEDMEASGQTDSHMTSPRSFICVPTSVDDKSIKV